MKSLIFLICFLCLFSLTTMGEDFLSKDSVDLFKDNNWYIFNGSMELGNPGKRVPGFLMLGFFEPKAAAKNVNKNYFPTTKREANGNKYLLMPGYKGLPEYNLYCNKFFLSKDGEVEISFRSKMTADENGKFQEKCPVILDFRCRNDNVQHGIIKQRYPVLTSKKFRPIKEWKTFKYKIKVVGGFVYSVAFRRCASNPDKNLNGLCFDDISIKYIGKSVKKKTELAIIPDRLISAYYKGEKAVFKVNAIISSDNSSEAVRLYVREDYSNKVFKGL